MSISRSLQSHPFRKKISADLIHSHQIKKFSKTTLLERLQIIDDNEEASRKLGEASGKLRAGMNELEEALRKLREASNGFREAPGSWEPL